MESEPKGTQRTKKSYAEVSICLSKRNKLVRFFHVGHIPSWQGKGPTDHSPKHRKTKVEK
jgi:hypothetical protein